MGTAEGLRGLLPAEAILVGPLLAPERCGLGAGVGAARKKTVGL